jgi:uncharacterized coiled-coil DUF342 family protein
MITKEELLVALEDSSRNLYKSNEVFGLALKGLESESTVKRLIQDRDNWKMMHENLVCEHRIEEHFLVVGGLTRSRNLWRKKHDDLADELDDKIIALEEMLKAKDADLSEASTIINDARTKHRALEAQLIESMAGEHASVDDANRSILQLRYESDAFQRCVGELQTEKSCLQADLENVCKEQEALKGKINELEEELGSKDDDWRLSVSYYMNLAAVWEKQAKELKVKVEAFEAFFTGKD